MNPEDIPFNADLEDDQEPQAVMHLDGDQLVEHLTSLTEAVLTFSAQLIEMEFRLAAVEKRQSKGRKGFQP